MEDIDHYEIPIYNFTYDVEEDDEETIADNMELRVSSALIDLTTVKSAYIDYPPYRLCFPSQLSGLKKKLNSTGNLSVLEYIPGVSSK